MQPGSGRLRLSDETPAGSDGDSVPGQQRLAVPAGPLLHFVYHVPARRQYLAPLPQPPDSAQVGSSQKQTSVLPNRCSNPVSFRRAVLLTSVQQLHWTFCASPEPYMYGSRTGWRRWRGCMSLCLARLPATAKPAPQRRTRPRPAARSQRAPPLVARYNSSHTKSSSICVEPHSFRSDRLQIPGVEKIDNWWVSRADRCVRPCAGARRSDASGLWRGP